MLRTAVATDIDSVYSLHELKNKQTEVFINALVQNLPQDQSILKTEHWRYLPFFIF